MKCDSVAAWVSPDLSVLLNTPIMLTIEIYMFFVFFKSDGKTNNSRMSGAFIQSGAESVENDVVKESTVSQLFAILARPQWGKFAALSVWSKPFYSETHNYKVPNSLHWNCPCTSPWQHNMWTQPSAPQLFILTNSLFFPPPILAPGSGVKMKPTCGRKCETKCGENAANRWTQLWWQTGM